MWRGDGRALSKRVPAQWEIEEKTERRRQKAYRDKSETPTQDKMSL